MISVTSIESIEDRRARFYTLKPWAEKGAVLITEDRDPNHGVRVKAKTASTHWSMADQWIYVKVENGDKAVYLAINKDTLTVEATGIGEPPHTDRTAWEQMVRELRIKDYHLPPNMREG